MYRFERKKVYLCIHITYIYILYVTQYGVNVQSRLEERERGVEKKKKRRENDFKEKEKERKKLEENKDIIREEKRREERDKLGYI